MYVGTLGALGSCFRGSQGVMTGDFQHEIYLEHGTHAGNVVCTVHPAGPPRPRLLHSSEDAYVEFK